MNFMPEYDFQKCINRHKGNDRVRKRSCREHFLHMSFTQTLGLTQFEKNLIKEQSANENTIRTCPTRISYHCGISQHIIQISII
jgi:hypothetical protein